MSCLPAPSHIQKADAEVSRQVLMPMIDVLPLQLHSATAERTLALGVVLHAAAVGLVASRARAGLVLALVNL